MRAEIETLKTKTKRSLTESFIKKNAPLLYDKILDRTSYLIDCKFNERLHHIEYDLYARPKCTVCNNDAQWFYDYKRYKNTCSYECFLKDDSRFQKIKNTLNENYGGPSAFSSKDIRDKSVQTVINKYGVDNVMKSEEVKEHYKNSMLESYGYTSNLLSPDIREQIKSTNIERYGAENVFSNESSIRGDITASILQKYGIDNVSKLLISPDSRVLLEDEQWLRTKIITEGLPLYEIAEMLDCDPTTISNWASKFNIDVSKQKESFIERKLYDALSSNYSGIIERHNRTLIAPLELDLVIPEYKLAIEICGLYWHSDKFKDKNYHKVKQELCNEVGYTLLTIYEDEIHDKFNIVLKSILHKMRLNKDTSIYARKTCIRLVDKSKKKIFLDNHHIQGNDKSSIAYGLFKDETLVAVMSINDTAGNLILSRYATSGNVVGGFTKLLKHVTKLYVGRSITTFADLRWSEGDLYKNNGFIEDGHVAVSYEYIKRGKRFHKFNLRKSFMIKSLGGDPKLSESAMASSLGFLRIYDCGKIRYKLI